MKCVQIVKATFWPDECVDARKHGPWSFFHQQCCKLKVGQTLENGQNLKVLDLVFFVAY